MTRAAAVLLAAALLCAAVQAAVAAGAADGSLVLMEGYPSPEAAASISSFKTGTLGLMHRREHKKHQQVAHKHRYHYPEHRQTIQETLAQFERCLKRAAALLDPSNPEGTLPAAGEAFVDCINQYLDVCIDVPSLDQLVAGIVPAQLLLAGLDVLVQNQDLVYAQLVFDFYMEGAGTAGSCAAKLKAALQAALPHRRWVPNLLHSLAKVLVQILKETLAGNDPLGDCAADVPAVLLSLASSYCPGDETNHPGKLLQPTPGEPVACNNATGPQYQNGPGALLTGSVLTFMVLSDDAALQKLGLTLAFTMHRLGLAASQTVSYTNCMTSLNDFLDDVPSASGVLPTGIPGAPDIIATVGPPPSKDGKRTLCSTIVALSGEEDSSFRASLLHQGNVNVWVAIAETAVNAPLPTSSPIRLKLCQALRAAWTFIDDATDIVYNLVDVGDSGDPRIEFNGCVTLSSLSEEDCDTNQTPPQRPDWLALRPEVEASHDFYVMDVQTVAKLCDPLLP